MAVKDAMSAAATTLIAIHSLGRNKRIVASLDTTTHHKASRGTLHDGVGGGAGTAMVMPSPGFMGSGKSASLRHAEPGGGECSWVC